MTVFLAVIGVLVLLVVVVSTVERMTARHYEGQQRKHLETIEALRSQLRELENRKGDEAWDEEAHRRNARDWISMVERLVKEGTASYELSYLYDKAHPIAEEGERRWRYDYALAALALDEAEKEFHRRIGGVPELFADETPEQKAIWKELFEEWRREYPEADAARRRVNEEAYRRVHQFKAIEAVVRLRERAEKAIDGTGQEPAAPIVTPVGPE